MEINKQDIVGRECRFAVHCGRPDGTDKDLHIVKEIIHTKDGRQIPNTILWPDFKRPFWVTKPGARNHEQKKEWEDSKRLDRFMSTQSDLDRNIARALGKPGFKGDPRQLSRSPYLYGSDILSTAVIKRTYQDKWPEVSTPYTNAPFDTETDVVHGTNQIIMATISYKDRVFTAVQSWFLEGITDVHAQAQEALHKYLGDYVKKRGIKWELRIVESEVSVVTACLEKAHEWKPDIVSIWNINFDINKVIEAFEKAQIDPKFYFSDPSVPDEYKFFKYKQGPKQKKTASNKISPIKPADQWHTVYTPASFYFIDAMCVYRKIRVAKGEEPSYSLDYILNKNLGIRKLKFKEADHLSGIDWHRFMQTRYKIEYIIYNVFDCVSMEILDEKTKDLQIALPMQSGCSDFETFKSQPRRTADNLHYFVQNHGKVFGSTSDEMTSDLDKLTLGLDGWIVTLPAHLVDDNGLQIIEENPGLRTNIRAHVGDLDVSASYPNGECVFNISKETTRKELCRVQGIPEYTQRMQGINLSGGATNAVEFATTMFKLPTMETLLDAFMAEVA